VKERRLDLLVDEAELAKRRAHWKAPDNSTLRGYDRLFRDRVLQAPEGCDFDFLAPSAAK
jgi:dihydroxy-acid dehydratase